MSEHQDSSLSAAAPARTPDLSAKQPLYLKLWSRVSAVLAVIGLASLAEDTIRWVRAIHWVVDQYQVVRSWLFGWIPFYIPDPWQDFIVLALILVSITNAGYFARTGRLFLWDATVRFAIFIVSVATFLFLPWLWIMDKLFSTDYAKKGLDYVTRLGVTLFYDKYFSPSENKWFDDAANLVLLTLLLFVYFSADYIPPRYIPTENTLWFVAASLLVGIIGGGFLAWRWLAVTGLVFAGLVGVNELYVQLLEPIGY